MSHLTSVPTCTGPGRHFLYVCPQSNESECVAHGGFDVCCGDSDCPSKSELGRYVRSVRQQVEWIPSGEWAEELVPYEDEE